MAHTEGPDREPEPGSRRRWLKVIPAALAVIAVVGSVIYYTQLTAGDPPVVGAVAPDFTLETVAGQEVALSEQRGSVVFINFWATHCITCRAETPAIDAFHQRYGDRLVFLSVNLQEPSGLIEDFQRQFGVTFPVLRDRLGTVKDLYRVTGTPETFVLDEEGIVHFHHRGGLYFEDLQELYEATAGRSIDPDGVGPLAAGEELRAAAMVNGTNGIGAADEAVEVPVLLAGERVLSGSIGGGWDQVAFPDGALPLVVDVARSDDDLVALDQNGGLWRIGAGGQPEVFGDPVPTEGGFPSALAAVGQTTYVWVNGDGLWMRPGPDRDWERASVDGDGFFANSLTVDPQRTQRLLAGTPEGVVESRDGGRTWARADVTAETPDPGDRIPWDPNFPRAVYDIAFSPTTPDQVYLATYHGVWIGDEAGQRISYLRDSPARALVSLSVHAGDDGRDRLLAAAPNGDLYWSDDSGASWRLVQPQQAAN